MSKKIFVFATALLIALSLGSCLTNRDEKDQTAEEEATILNKYIASLISKGNNVDTTELGVYYVKTVEGTGAFPQNGDTCKIGYAGYFIEGTLFDASWDHSKSDSTVTFIIGDPQMLAGLNDGLKLLNKGAVAELILPSQLAWGSNGSGFIPGNKTVIFVVNMKDIIPKK